MSKAGPQLVSINLNVLFSNEFLNYSILEKKEASYYRMVEKYLFLGFIRVFSYAFYR